MSDLWQVQIGVETDRAKDLAKTRITGGAFVEGLGIENLDD